MDWGAVEDEAARNARSPEDTAAVMAAARAIVAAHGEQPVPKDVDAFVRARAEAGASAAELALAQRAGDLLVRTIRARAQEKNEAAPPTMPPAVLARMPASYFAGASGDEERTALGRVLRRHAWALDVGAIAVGAVLFATRLAYWMPVGVPYDPRRALLMRVVGLVSSATILAGLAGLAQRAGLLDGALFDRAGNRTARLRFLQARGFLALRGALILVSAILLVVLPSPPPRPDGRAGGAPRAEWPAWMTALGVMARLPAGWTYLRTTELHDERGAPFPVAWMSDGDGEIPTHGLTTARGAFGLAEAHARAVPIAREAARRTDGIDCRPQPPVTRADVLCVREQPEGPFVMACSDHAGRVQCLASWGPGDARTLAEETERALREVMPRER